MSRVYATREDTRERVLVEIKGGWTGSSTEYEACPRHRHLLEEAVGT